MVFRISVVKTSNQLTNILDLLITQAGKTRQGQTRTLINLLVWQPERPIADFTIIRMRIHGWIVKIDANASFLKIRPEPITQLWIFDTNYIKMPSAL